MKIKNYSLFILALLLFNACGDKNVDEPQTKPVEFTETTYEFLGTFDANGKPNYLLPRDAISANMLSYINSNIPDGSDLRKKNPDLLKTKSYELAITQQSDVFITFVLQGTLTTDAIGFYTYPTNNPPTSPTDIKKITYIFPNAGNGTPLLAGDKVKIGRFDAGTSVGFVLLHEAWSTATKSLNNKAVHFCSNDFLNPEVDPNLKKHVVLINYAPENKVLIGFEDTDRSTAICDHDFQDVVVYATITP
jgi:hypothetical protein